MAHARTLAEKILAVRARGEPNDGIWTLIHDGERPPTVNWTRGQTNHWSQIAAKTREWRHAYWVRAKQANIPHLEQVEFDIYPLHKDLRSPQDAGACLPAGKAAIDGICCAMDGRPWDDKQVDDGPARVLGVNYRSPASGCGVDGMLVVVRALRDDHRLVGNVSRTLIVPVTMAVTNMLSLRVGRVDARLWGVEAGKLLDAATIDATG